MAHAEADGDQIIVATQWNERELIKQVPGTRWNPSVKMWHVPLTWTACVQLRGVFSDRLTIGPRLVEWAWAARTRVDHLLKLRARIAPDTTDPVDDLGLYPFQRVGMDFLRLAREVILGDEMGTGKTVQALVAINAIGSAAFPALVVCPNAVKTHWASEITRWTDATPYVITGGTIGRRKIIETASEDSTAIVVVNIEALRLLTRLAPFGSVHLKHCRVCDPKNGEEGLPPSRCQVHPKELNRVPFRTVIVDEAHGIKSPQSQQTRAAWAVGHMASVRYRWALTGTPVANHPGDVWSLLHFISPRDFPTKTNFIDRYCLQAWSGFGGLDIVGLNPATRDEFYALLDVRFRCMPKSLVLDQLPPKVRSTRWVELTPAQTKTYRELENGFGTWISGGVLTTSNSLVSLTRRMQLASSSVRIERDESEPDDLDGWNVRLVEPSPKIDDLVAVLDELEGHQVAVCAEHRQLIELAAARLTKLSISFGLITGGVSEYERDLALRRFQDGQLRVLLFTIKTGGTGLTMTAADTMIFLQRSWSMIGNVQAEDRVHRIGSERHSSVHIIDIVARDTVEEDQIARLYDKFQRLQEIRRDRETLRLAGNGEAIRDLDAEESMILESEV